MNYSIIDLNTWERGSLFKFYIDNMRIVMSLTADIDVAPLLAYARKNNLKFYSAMIWVVSVYQNHNKKARKVFIDVKEQLFLAD